jgi:hypothetical protein
MPFEVGLFTDLSDEQSIADPIVLVRAQAIQLPGNLGRFWNDMPIDMDQESNRQFDIYSRTETQRSGTVGAGGWDAVATTALPVTSATGLIKGLVLRVESEYVVIDTVDTGANTISVRERGAAGTTAAAHVATTAYTIVGSAIDDVDLKDINSVSEITTRWQNYMQTVAEPIDYTRGGEIDVRKGLSERQLAVLEEEAMIRVARNVFGTSINGLKQAKATNKPWMCAGLLQQLSNTVGIGGDRPVLTYNVNGELDEAKFKEAFRIVTERGTPTDIYVSSANKDTINEFLGAADATRLSVNTEMANTTAGYYVDSYNYEGLIMNVKIDLGMPDDQIAAVNINKTRKGWKSGDELRLEKQPDLSSREHRSAYNGSFYLALEDVGYDHILMTGITQP